MQDQVRLKSVLAGIAVLLLPMLSFSLRADSLRLAKLPIQTLTLPNGLQAILEADRRLPVVTIEVWYRVGSKNEPPAGNGYAHLLEHLMFDGTKTVPAGDFASAAIRAGGEVNAYTDWDNTVFWEVVPTSALQQMLGLEADRMRNLKITSSHMANERKVVEEERRMRFEDPSYGPMLIDLYAKAFTVSPYRRLPIGNPKDLNRATVGEIRKFYKTYYRPNNATVLVVGDFNADQAAQWIQQDFGPLRKGRALDLRACVSEPKQKHERTMRVEANVQLPAFLEGFHVPSDGTPASYALELLTNVLSEGETSLFYRTLVARKQLVVEADAEANFTECPNLFTIQGVMNSGHSARQGESAVARILKTLRDHPISENELERAKNQLLTEWVEDRETSHGRADQLGEDGVVLQDPGLVNTEINRVLDLTPAEIQSAAQKYLVKKNMTLIEYDAEASAKPSARQP